MAKNNDTTLRPVRSKKRKYSSELAYVYVIEDDNGLIKTGHSENPTRRLKQIQRMCGFNIVHRHFSPLCYNFSQVEEALQAAFGERLKQEEYVQHASFEEVCAVLDKQTFQTELVSASEQRLLPFQFQEHQVRISVDQTGEAWFCLKDVCEVLNITNPSNVVKRLKPEGVVLVDVLCDLDLSEVTSETEEICDLHPVEVTSKSRKTQSMSFVNKPNLYRVIFKSAKPEAIMFQDWVFEEVLPSIDKMGYYNLYGETNPSTQSLVNDVAQATLEKLATALAPLTKNPVITVQTQEGSVKKVQVTFQVKLSFEVKED